MSCATGLLPKFYLVIRGWFFISYNLITLGANRRGGKQKRKLVNMCVLELYLIVYVCVFCNYVHMYMPYAFAFICVHWLHMVELLNGECCAYMMVFYMIRFLQVLFWLQSNLYWMWSNLPTHSQLLSSAWGYHIMGFPLALHFPTRWRLVSSWPWQQWF